jgi:hypothetical protein
MTINTTAMLELPKITRTYLDNLYQEMCQKDLEIHDIWTENGKTYLSFQKYNPDLFDDGTRYIMFFFGYLPQAVK